MALSFPLSMPQNASTLQYFEPERVDLQTERADGRVNGVSVGWPLWHARWTLGPSIARETAEQWRATVTALRGSQRTFFGGDESRPFPRLYPNGFVGLSRAGGGAFDGTASNWSVNADRDTPTFSGFPAGLVLSWNDYIMFRWETGGSARRALVRAVEVADATSGGLLSIAAEPAVPNVVPGNAIADLVRPVCIMKLKPETKIGEMGRLQKIDGQIHAIQDLRA